MKVTAIIPDDVLKEVRAETQARTITESLVTALREWLAMKRIHALNRKVAQEPLRFEDGFTAEKTRARNRRR